MADNLFQKNFHNKRQSTLSITLLSVCVQGKAPAQQLWRHAALLVGLPEHPARNDDGDVLIRSNDVEDHAGECSAINEFVCVDGYLSADDGLMLTKCLLVVSLLNRDINAPAHVDRTVLFDDARSMPIKRILRLGVDVNVDIHLLDASDFLADAQPICVIAMSLLLMLARCGSNVY